MISFNIDPSFAISGLEEVPWSVMVRDTFDLRECTVVAVDVPASDSGFRADLLHVGMANCTGTKIRESIASGDHIAVAGGRAVHRLAQFIKRNPPSKKDIRITPLSGRTWSGSWQLSGPDNLELPLDADDNALVLANAFDKEPGTRFSQISHPLYATTASLAHSIMREHCATLPNSGWNWGLKPPDRAFVGVGVIDPQSGHRISAFLRSRNTIPQKEKTRPTSQG